MNTIITKKAGVRWKLLQRNHGVFYAHNTATNERKSLKTRDRRQAEEKLQAMNIATDDRQHCESLAMIYLQKARRTKLQATWADVMKECCGRANLKAASVERMSRAYAGKDFDAIRNLRLTETHGEHFLKLIARQKPSVTNYLKILQGRALTLQWIMIPILAGKAFQAPKAKESRPITEKEHRKILAAEQNTERRNYYRMLWLIGAAQTDCANLTAENFDRDAKVLTYTRKKTGELCQLAYGKGIQSLLDELPSKGYLFPKIQQIPQNDRSSEFRRRCRCESVAIKGVNLHSYRYAWAVRAAEAGIPIRFAQAALGHKSETVARAYAKSAVPVCPAFD